MKTEKASGLKDFMFLQSDIHTFINSQNASYSYRVMGLQCEEWLLPAGRVRTNPVEEERIYM